MVAVHLGEVGRRAAVVANQTRVCPGRQQLFDLNLAKEAKARLTKQKPFGN